jgi:hypothetical protein
LRSRYVVKPRVSIIRQFVLPIYGTDQLLLVLASVLILASSVLITHDRELTIYICVGAYLGFVLSMQRSTPSALTLPAVLKRQVVSKIDGSPYMVREQGHDTWRRAVGRVRRWNSDTVRLLQKDDEIILLGRKVDLEGLRLSLGLGED